MEMLQHLSAGFEAAFTLTNMLFICGGVTLGIIFGVTPGMGSVTALAILVPVTFYMSPLAAIAFLVGINKGGTSGGAIPAILINTPGTPEAAATALDGYPMTQQGKPLKAMKTALYSSVCGDTFSDCMLILLAAPFAAIALTFGPPEFTSIIIFSFTLIAALAGKSLIKGIMAAVVGVFLSSWGLDPVDGSARLTFDMVELFDGVPLTPMAIGTLALSSVIAQVFSLKQSGEGAKVDTSLEKSASFKEDNKLPAHEFWGNWKTLIRSACIGTGVGMLPGLGVSLAAFLGYGAAKRGSKTPELFGKGTIEGIQATEASNSAVVGSNLIPTIALGIPGNVAAALLIGAFMIHGVVPGPLMMIEHGALVYSIFASMLMANLAHLIIGRIGITIWVKFVQIPKKIILPVVTVFCFLGVYIPSNSMFDVALLLIFGALGYVMRKSGFSIVCLVIGFLLGPMLEMALRQTMLMHKTDLTILVTRPISLVFLLLTLFFIWHFGFRPRFKKDKAQTGELEPDGSI
jgi:putative tricarboxylic transport membrane protein